MKDTIKNHQILVEYFIWVTTEGDM